MTRVLVADDDRLERELLTRSLQRWGYEVLAVEDGHAALDAAAGNPRPAMAIIDWEMPGLDGLGVCAAIRQNPLLSTMYVIMLTGRASRGERIAGLEAGADDYIVKPFDTSELRLRLRVGERVTSLQQKLAARVDELEEALARIKSLQGLLPICSYCKRIRTDEDYWEQVESYISAHSDAVFSHGICPTCFDRVQREVDRL